MDHRELKRLALPLGQHESIDLVNRRDHQAEMLPHHGDFTGQCDREDRATALQVGIKPIAVARGRDRVTEGVDDAGLLVLEQNRFDAELQPRERRASRR